MAMKIKDKLILTDVDGVLLDWNFGFEQYMLNRGVVKVSSNYDLSEAYNLDKEIAGGYADRFCRGRYLGKLPPFRDAVKYIRKLHEEFGYTFHAITAVDYSKETYQYRKKNLENLFGKGVFDRIKLTGCKNSKISELEKYKDTGCIWVEDHLRNACDGVQLGLNTFLMDHDYNQRLVNNTGITTSEDYITRVKCWRDIYDQAYVDFYK